MKQSLLLSVPPTGNQTLVYKAVLACGDHLFAHFWTARYITEDKEMGTIFYFLLLTASSWRFAAQEETVRTKAAT